MPTQLLQVEIMYDPIDDNGDLRPPPAEWAIESALDTYCEGESNQTYTRQVRIKPTLAGVQPLDSDIAAANEWHENHCDDEDYCRASGEAQEKYPCVFVWDEDGEQYRRGDAPAGVEVS